MSARELSFAGLFGAAALLLPVIFHLLALGHALMPMYIPLVALAFLVSAGVATTTAVLVPLLSAAVTGMPPLYPPIAVIMALELGFMCWLIAIASSRFPAWRPLIVLLPVLIAGRVLNYLLSYVAAVWMELPPYFLAGLSFIAGWPGVLLMLVVVPPLIHLLGRRGVTH